MDKARSKKSQARERKCQDKVREKKQGFELGEVRVDWTRRQKRLWKKKRRKNSKLK